MEDKSRAEDVLPKGYRAIRIAALALAATAVATGVTVGTGGSAQAATTRPSIEAPQADPVVVVYPRHSTVFARGVWLDMGRGKVYVNAPLRELVPGLGWLPSPFEEVDVQKLTAGRWVTVARLQTGADGRARGYVRVGGGVDYLRVVHPRDRYTLPAVGSTRRVEVTTEPLDIV